MAKESTKKKGTAGVNIIYIGHKHKEQFRPEQLIQFTPSEKADDTIHYSYRNYDVDRTIGVENGVLVQIVAVTPLGVKAGPLSEKEVTGLLAHFGFDDRIPFSVREKTHPYRPFTGSTLYYSQPVVILSNVG